MPKVNPVWENAECDMCPFCVFTPFPTCGIETEYDPKLLASREIYKYHCEVIIEKIEEDAAWAEGESKKY